ncbi:DNA-binding response regulator, NarL/FixJ family, contains REC and HTH domains [Fontibacillus panacisegetis]|uniref:DNA-binding response regulator, NarL/FixJ family, contains REC and HTH domains n=1 Tax=Fontibacillus panacisegetis TaxID=670482 RepID=A0A1G7H9F8_9BACL|nr:response regulator transcription factor [Fontibacillus panacisegetis]SDE97097.1 DNA-binding response regulator, NarL/FixJ family, contains REC and HTH domains [Fontibacillus panacisegetis]
MTSIRIMLVEDDPFWRDHISADLTDEADIEVVGVATTKEEAIDMASRINIDVILMDINLTGNNLDGLEAAEHILRQQTKHDTKIIMLTSITEAEIVMKSFRLGALNYINKSSYQDILNAIRDAYSGKASIHSDAAKVMRNEVQLMELSPTEREVFDLRKTGLSKREISEKLHKSTNTIKTQLRSIKNKLTHFKIDE